MTKRVKHPVPLLLAGLIMLSAGVVYVLLFAKRSSLPPAPDGQRWQLVFDEQFNQQTLDTTRWTTCYDWYSEYYQGCTNSGNNEREWYMPGQVNVGQGIATLTAAAKPVKGWNKTYEDTFPYISGMLSTGRTSQTGSPKWTSTYGYYEARIQVPTGKGLWPAFWLLPADGTWPPEIDVMELLGDKPNQVLMTYHWGSDPAKPQKDFTIFTGSDFTQGWHTYAINWQPKHIDWYIDGELRKSVTSDNVPSKPMEVLLNLAVGGDLPRDPDASTRFPARMSIDYVRVYSLAKK